eukprot:110253_1
MATCASKLPTNPQRRFIIIVSSLILFINSCLIVLNMHPNVSVPSWYQVHTDTKSPKLVFLFLTRDNVLAPKIWDIFFGNEDDKQYYNIYVHSKYPANISKTQPYMYDNALPQHTLIKHTARYHVSLVHASNVLFKTAFEDDPNNKKFILLSESHVPLHNFKTIYSKLMDDDEGKSYFADSRHRLGYRNRYNYIKKIYLKHHNHSVEWFERNFVSLDDFFPSSQWIILDRYLIKKYLIKYEKRWNHFYRPSSASDESYYSTLFHKYLSKAEWDQRIQLTRTTRTEIPYNHGGHAKVFENVSDSFIDNLRKQKYLFLRKVTQQSDINVSYLLF